MPSDQVQTLQRAFRILDCFTRETPSLGVREAARMVNLSSSTTGRLLAAMKEAGILTQNPQTRSYSLGSKVLLWAGVYANTLDIRVTALPYLHELRQLTQETITLYILDGFDRVCVERLESQQNVRITSRIGQRLPLYAGSAGKAMLAFLPSAKQDELLCSHDLIPLTQATIVDPDRLRMEIERIRTDGYALSRGEWLLEASGIAAPIFDQGGDVVAAVTISGPGQRFTDEAFAEYIPLIRRVADQISRDLGDRDYSSRFQG